MDEIDQVLEVALERELESVRIYKYLLNQNPFPDYKAAISNILEHEVQHVQTIKQLMSSHNFDGIGISKRDVSHIIHVEAPTNFEEVKDSPLKMVAFAIKKEDQSIQFYRKMLETYKTHIILFGIIKKLIIEEDNHKTELEKMYRKLK